MDTNLQNHEPETFPEVGDIWEDVEPVYKDCPAARHRRKLRITAIIGLTVHFVNEESKRCGKAKVSRFNGEKGGYRQIFRRQEKNNA